MSRATDDQLDALHGLVAESLLAEIRAYRANERTDGETPKALPSALLAQAIQFLKANGVDRAVKPGDPEDLLAGELADEFGSNVMRFPIR